MKNKMEYDFIHINNYSLGGINRPMINIEGNVTTPDFEVELYANGSKVDCLIKTQKDKFYDLRKKQTISIFNVSTILPKNIRTIEIYIIIDKKRYIIIDKKCGLLRRILNRVLMPIKSRGKIKRIYKTTKKVIKIAWKRHKFIIPPRLIKRYIKAIYRNLVDVKYDDFYDPFNQQDYLKWILENENETEYQKFEYNPLISILIPVYNVSRKYLMECVESVLNQSYINFEICIADDCSKKQGTIETLKDIEKLDKRIKVIYREKNGHISEATNSALEIATGEFIGLLDNDDLLHKDALYEVVKLLNEDKSIDMIYTDEDKIDIKGNRCAPNFKPDFSPDTLMSLNYICHFTVIRKNLVEKAKGFRKEYDGAQDHDLFLRISELTSNIRHISKILYHWRMIEGSTASSNKNKNYAYIAGKKAVEAALKRRKTPGFVNENEEVLYYSVNYTYIREPKISIIIPTRDYADILNTCLESIYTKTIYKNFEIIIVDNGSVEQETFELFEKYTKLYNNIKILKIDHEFNYSYLNNEAIKITDGEYILLLNNDTEVITPEWLSVMVGYAMQKHVGCVGSKLLYPDTTVQHAGIILGLGGIASHAYIGAARNDTGIYGRISVPYNYSGVTAACLMISKSKFNEVNGLDEELKVAYNDVDFCIKLLEKGYHNVFLPQVELFHHESKSRGLDTTSEKYERFMIEIDYMNDKWGNKVKTDNYYNKNFSYNGWFVLDKKKVKKNEK